MRWPDNRSDIRQQYENDGFVILRQFFDAAQVEQVQANLQRYIETIVPQLPAMDAFFETVRDKQQVRMLSRMARHDEFFRGLLIEGGLPQVASELGGWEVAPHDIVFFNKLPLIGDATPPHQDGFYFHLSRCEAVTLWLALDEIDETNGCIHYVKGSHRHGMRPHARTEVLGFSQAITDYGEEDKALEVAACVAPGDLIIHDAMTIHRAPANRSPRSRRALGSVFFSREAQVDHDARENYQRELAADWKQKGRI